MDKYKRLTLASCVFACLSASITNAETLRFSIGEDPESLYNVATNSLTANSVINTYLLERLVYFDAEGQAQPWLAESWEVSADQKTLTFQLREGITFHDGTPFNAAAVVYHFDAIRDPNNASPQAAKLGPLDTVEALSENSVQFTFSDPYAPFFNMLAGEAGGINSPSAVQAGGAGYGRSPVGTGPFKFESWLPGSEISLVRNDDYHGQVRADAMNQGAPHAERVVLSVISEAGVAQAALEAGELTGAGLQADTIGQFVDHPDFTTVIDETATNLVFLEFNSAKAPWDNPEMRRAIGYAIDRKAAAAAAWSGYASVALSPLAVGIPGHDAEIGVSYGTPYDPGKAAALLDELGWVDSNGDGIREKDGQAAEFLIKSYAGFTHITRTLQVIQANLDDIGIKAELETADWGAFYPSLLEDDWDMDLMRWTSNDAGILTELFKSPGHRNKLAPNPAIDDLLTKCDTTLDPVIRFECVANAQKALLKDMTIVPILTSWDVFATQANVKDYTIDYLGYLLPGDVRIEE